MYVQILEMLNIITKLTKSNVGGGDSGTEGTSPGSRTGDTNFPGNSSTTMP